MEPILNGLSNLVLPSEGLLGDLAGVGNVVPVHHRAMELVERPRPTPLRTLEVGIIQL